MRPAECPQDSTAARTLVTLSRPASVERCGQQRDCSGSTGEVTSSQEVSEWQVRKQSVSWGSLSGIGWKPRAAARGGSVGQGETPRTEEAWVSHLLQGEVAEGVLTGRGQGRSLLGRQRSGHKSGLCTLASHSL